VTIINDQRKSGAFMIVFFLPAQPSQQSAPSAFDD